jgi:hypothetical protein
VDIYSLGKGKFENAEDNTHLPPENVFIIDINTWDKIVQIIKDGQASLLDILLKAQRDNSKPGTKKQSFDMHLDIYDTRKLNLSYLAEEIDCLKIKK